MALFVCLFLYIEIKKSCGVKLYGELEKWIKNILEIDVGMWSLLSFYFLKEVHMGQKIF